METLTISICRQSKSWAVFDAHLACVKEFVPYTDEAAALAEGKAWVAERGKVEPEVVYPNLTRFSMSTSRPRRC